MRAIEFQKSVPRYLASRYLGPRWPGIYTSSMGSVRLRDLPPPQLPGDTWVRVRPLLTGICGSDLATLTAQGTPYFSPLTSFPFVLGHEVVGEVVETGTHAGDWRAGDRVVLMPPLHCAIRGVATPCSACAAGDLTHCRNITRGTLSAGIQTGFCRDTGGGWSEGFVAEARQLQRVPSDLPDEVAVLVEPFACCLHAVQASPLAERFGQADPRTALVLGSGTIGLLTIAALRAAGSQARIVAVAKHPHQRERAKSLGADLVLETRDLHAQLVSTLGAEIYQPELGGPVVLGGADVAFECVGSERSLADALRFTCHRGSVILVGMPAMPRLDWTGIWHKELVVRGAYTSSPATFVRAIELVHRNRAALAGIAAARFTLDRYREAIDTALHAGQAGVVKTVFAP